MGLRNGEVGQSQIRLISCTGMPWYTRICYVFAGKSTIAVFGVLTREVAAVPLYQLIILLWDKVWKLLRTKKTATQTKNNIDNNKNKTLSGKATNFPIKRLQLLIE
jgi:hypothetical protein